MKPSARLSWMFVLHNMRLQCMCKSFAHALLPLGSITPVCTVEMPVVMHSSSSMARPEAE
jgi:hypothetical protein